jgi:HEAT repeat protein
VLSIGGGLLLIGGGIALLFILLTPNEVDAKLADLKSEDPAVRGDALQWLVKAEPQDAKRTKVIETLEALIFEGSSNLNPEMVLQAYLHWVDKESVPAMIRMVETPPTQFWDVGKTGRVMETLGRMKDERAIEPLVKKLPDFFLHVAAVNALKLIGPSAQNAVLPYLFHNNPVTRMDARQLLASFGTKSDVIAGEAQRRLDSNEPDVQRSALAWFAENGPSEESKREAVAKVLIRHLDDLTPDTRTTAVRGLKLWATKSCLPKLLEFARREEKAPFGNDVLLEVLAQFKDETAAEAIAIQLTNFHVRVGGKVRQALLNMGPVATKAVLGYLNHPDGGVQNEARELCRLLNISPDRQLEQTVTDVGAAEIARRRAALQSLTKLQVIQASRDKVARALNEPLLDSDNGIRQEALNAVKIWGSKANTATLVKVLQGKDGDKGRVIEILGILKDPEAAPVLAKSLTNFFERGPASKALKAIGSAAETAVIECLKSADGQVRGEACRILAEIGTLKSLVALDAAARFWRQDVGFVREAINAYNQIKARK